MAEPEKRYVYQLKATGEGMNGGRQQLYSTTVFTSENLARERFPRFRQMVTDHRNIRAIEDNDLLEIEIIPLEIVE